MSVRLRTLGVLGLLAALTVIAPLAVAQTQTSITFTYPVLPASTPPNLPDNDGILNLASHTFQEGGMHVESFWVKNNAPVFAQGHFHIHFPNPYEATHGNRFIAGLGPDRLGIYLRREDGGPFDLTSLDYRLVVPAAANILIGTSYNPSLPATQQLTAFPVVTNANFQTLTPAGFTGVTQLFIVWDLTEAITDLGNFDNIVITIPPGTCSKSQPAGVVVSHSGLTNPTTEGWTSNGPSTGVTVGPISADLGYDSFFVNDASTVSDGWRSYVQKLSPDVMCWARTSGFTLRSRVRVANTADFTDGSVTMSFFDSLRLYELRLGSDGSNNPIVSVSGTKITLTGLGAGYHLYEMVYNPATKTVDLKVDGTKRLSNLPGVAGNVLPPSVTFGSPIGGANGVGEGRYARVEFELPPACSNRVDDDGDGLADFPADPGCSSAADTAETGACGNNTDDDGDGLSDFPSDPGCASSDDDSEKSAGLVCDDGADNDGDLAIDFPADSGCFSPTDTTETTACANGVDDDGDGLADYPSDPGCNNSADDSEQSSSLVCDDGIDNDGDLAIDFPADTGCTSSTDSSETTACANGTDDDGDGLADLADPGCAGANDDSEKSSALVCDDGLDNDGDTLVDFPADPGCADVTSNNESPQCNDGADNDGDTLVDLADSGCSSASDDLELLVLPACSDGLDNDGDALVDFPADPGCVDAASDNESPQCNDGVDNDGDGLADLADPGCAAANDASEKSLALVCDDGVDNDGDALVDFPADPGCASVTSNNESPQCNDGADNDGDTLVDLADPGCSSASDDLELLVLPACSDGLDNDGDGLKDYPTDTGCASLGDTSERGANICDNGTDDDGDGLTDYPTDTGCSSVNDSSERGSNVCDNGTDDDGDGTIDYPADAGCTSVADTSERQAGGAACDDTVDNDSNGQTDYPADAGCTGPTDTTEFSATKQTLWNASVGSFLPATAQTNYGSLVGNGAGSTGWLTATETARGSLLPAGTLNSLRFTSAWGTPTFDIGDLDDNIVATVMRNGVATSLTCTVSGSNTTKDEQCGTVPVVVDPPITVAAGDRFTMRIVTQGTPNTNGTVQWAVDFTPTTSNTTVMAGMMNTVAGSRYLAPGVSSYATNASALSTTDSEASVYVPIAGNITGVLCGTGANLSSAKTIEVIVNGSRVSTLDCVVPVNSTAPVVVSSTRALAVGDTISIHQSSSTPVGFVSATLLFAPTSAGKWWSGYTSGIAAQFGTARSYASFTGYRNATAAAGNWYSIWPPPNINIDSMRVDLATLPTSTQKLEISIARHVEDAPSSNSVFASSLLCAYDLNSARTCTDTDSVSVDTVHNDDYWEIMFNPTNGAPNDSVVKISTVFSRD